MHAAWWYVLLVLYWLWMKDLLPSYDRRSTLLAVVALPQSWWSKSALILHSNFDIERQMGLMAQWNYKPKPGIDQGLCNIIYLYRVAMCLNYRLIGCYENYWAISVLNRQLTMWWLLQGRQCCFAIVIIWRWLDGKFANEMNSWRMYLSWWW